MIALVVMVVVLSLLLHWAQRIASGVTGVTLYLVSASLLFVTSLRGWSVTGHDIQLEYRVFQLTAAHGKWNISYFKNAFNACLSITILPTEFASLMRMDDAYIYKVFFQLIFAACPVIVYTISRRYFSDRISILAAVYFIGFPVFVSDFPFLNRQEIALIFVGAGLLAVTNPYWSRRRRQISLVIASVCVELSHYSTSYVFIGTLLVAYVAEELALVGRLRLRRTRKPQASRNGTSKISVRTRTWKTSVRTLGIGILVLLGVVIGLWGGFATHTASGAAGEVKGAVSGFLNRSGGGKSSAVSYLPFSGKTQSPQSLLNQYREKSLAAVSKAPKGVFVSKEIMEEYPTPVVNQPNLPLTKVGRFLSDHHVPPLAFNTGIRLFAAVAEQAFVFIGILTLLLDREI